MPDRGARLVAILASAFLGGTAGADDAKKVDPAADAELLEFLGSVDSGADAQAPTGDGSWIDYLSQTDIGKVAKAGDPNGTPRKQPATGDQPPASGEKKDD